MMIWFQALSIKLLGFNELSTRLPAALCGLLTLIVLGVFIYRNTNNLKLSLIIVLVLLCSNGFTDDHGTRTGDYDAMLTLFVFLYSLCMYLYIETNKSKYLNLFFCFLLFSVLTKGIAALIMLSGICFYVMLKRKTAVLLKNKNFYSGLLAFTATSLSYYLLRELYNPGYLNAVLENEIFGRYLTNIEGHKEPFLFYMTNLMESRFIFFYPFLFIGVIAGFFINDIKLRNLSVYFTILSFSFLLIISSASSKLQHYDLPMYPQLAIITGIFIYTLILLIDKLDYRFIYKQNILSILIIPVIFWFPYTNAFNKSVKSKEPEQSNEFYSISYALKSLCKKPGNINEVKIIYDNYSPHLDFYRKVLELKGINSKYIKADQVKYGDVIVTYTGELTKIPSKYSYEIITDFNHAKVARVYSLEMFDSFVNAIKRPIDILECF